MTHVTYQPVYQLYACLPFVELAHEVTIRMGPITFWPASKFEEFIPSEEQKLFSQYIQTVGQVKARVQEKEPKWINTIHLPLQGTTCISIDDHVPLEQRDFILIDSLYLLYFACIFRNLYYGSEIPSFDVFRKIIPASFEFIENKENWSDLHINEKQREETVCIHPFDPEIFLGLGKMLSSIYHTNPQLHPTDATLIHYKRLIRSIRYLVDRFFQSFVNLFGKGLNLPEELFEPEDVIFLASSFEALFDINDKHPASDFKNKIRPLLHLKFSKPVERFWKWVDDFYELKQQVIHGGDTPDPIFRENPNFEVSHILIGIKLFVYSVYYSLFKYHLLQSGAFNIYTPPDFKWIHPEEVLLFFWTESGILTKLEMLIKQAKDKPHQEELYADIRLLANLFIFMYEHYYIKKRTNGVTFIPTSVKQLENPIHFILHAIEEAKTENPNTALLKNLPPEFPIYLMKRLAI